jgi:hypothetical protein
MWRIAAIMLLLCAGCDGDQQNRRPGWVSNTDHIFQSTDEFFVPKSEAEAPPPTEAATKPPARSP